MVNVPVKGGTGTAGTAVRDRAASTLCEEMAVSGQRLLAASGQIPMAATVHRGRNHLSDACSLSRQVHG